MSDDVIRVVLDDHVAVCAADRELIDAIRIVAKEVIYVQSASVRVLARRLISKPQYPMQIARTRFDRLIEREHAVLQMVGRGYSAPEIDRRLRSSHKTVDTYGQRIHEKMGLLHRAENVQLALRLGLLSAT